MTTVTVDKLLTYRDMLCSRLETVWELGRYLVRTSKLLDKYSAPKLVTLEGIVKRHYDKISVFERRVIEQFTDPIRTALEVGNARAGITEFQKNPDGCTTYTEKCIDWYLWTTAYVGYWYFAAGSRLTDAGVAWPDWLAEPDPNDPEEQRCDWVMLLESEMESRRDFGDIMAEVREEFARAISALPDSQRDASSVERMPQAAGLPATPSSGNCPGALDLSPSADPNAWLSAGDIAKSFGVPLEALKKRLQRHRKKGLLGHTWTDVQDSRGPRQPKYLYRVNYVMPLVRELKAKVSQKTSRQTSR